MKELERKPSNLDSQDLNREQRLHVELSQSNGNYQHEMSDTIAITNLRKDEYEINFEDTSAFAVERYEDIVKQIRDDILSHSDRTTITESRDCQKIQAEIQRMRLDPALNPNCKKLVNQFQPLPGTLNDLLKLFETTVHPYRPPVEPLWGLVYLNLRLSCESPAKLKKTADWSSRLRRTVETLNRCVDSCTDSNVNESRIAIVEAFDPILSAFAQSVRFLRGAITDTDVEIMWPAFDTQVTRYLSELDGTVKYLSTITSLPATNRQRIQKNIMARDSTVAESDTAKFPIKMLPFRQNTMFYGRELELKRIDQALDWRITEKDCLRTFTIYGRRGIGKTEMALEYAYSNPADFDAIFWVDCESKLTLRHSFTNIAKAVNLEGGDEPDRHEQNHLGVLQWLKKTRCHWLMIFDNAEQEHLLKGYKPMGASGAILFTSRRYYSFLMDDVRKGDTVKQFDTKQSMDILCQFLGEDWRNLQQPPLLKTTEVIAAEEFLSQLEGLPLSIKLAASAIKNEKIGGRTIESTFEHFKQHAKQLPERQLGKRSNTYHSLDTLWDMNFQLLSNNSQNLLKILSFLSPDTTYIDLFLPRNQAALNGKLSFCKQGPSLVNNNHVALASIIAPNKALEDALGALSKAGLVQRHERTLEVPHEVQEAINHLDIKDLQDSFDAAVRLVSEAFPKRRLGIPLLEQWATCSMYIYEGIYLAVKFAEHTRSAVAAQLKETDELVELIGNCAWYLYEISSYDEAIQIIEIGSYACLDKESLQYADLCNTAGVCYLEKNFLGHCREALETSLRVREAKLAPDDIDIAASTHNLGNLETATGNYDKAMEYFNQALKIRHTQGDVAATQLALLYLCIGRAHTLARDFDKALKNFAMAKKLFEETLGPEDHYMAHVYYAYGNVDYRSSDWMAARRSYTDSLRIALASTPIHPITAAAYMSLGNVEFKLGNMGQAKAHLLKARAIAELRSPTRDDGTVARILYVLHRVMSVDPLTAREAEDLRVRAETARNTLFKAGESALVDVFDQDGNLQPADEAKLYDALVPIFFR